MDEGDDMIIALTEFPCVLLLAATQAGKGVWQGLLLVYKQPDGGPLVSQEVGAEPHGQASPKTARVLRGELRFCALVAVHKNVP